MSAPSHERAILDAWKARRLSSQLAVMELLIVMGDAGVAARYIEEQGVREGSSRYAELLDLIRAHRAGCDRAAAIARRFEDGTEPAGVFERVETTRRRFDDAVSESEEASVALYSLGDPELLRAATDEVVRALQAWGLLGHDKDLLQIGCGIGRFEVALAPRVRSAVGVDVSPKMIEAARRRSSHLPNVRFYLGSGLDLAGFEDRSFDVVYAVDSMPYIVEAGAALVEAHFREAARVLRPRGEFVILGFSYRADPSVDSADLRRLSAAHGFDIVFDSVKPFEIWNGRAFRMQRTAGLTVTAADRGK